MIYPFSPTKLAGMDSAEPLTQKIASKGLVNSIRVYNFTPGFWQITNDYNVIIDIVPPWREKIMRVTDSQNYFATFQTTQPYFQTNSVNNTQYQFGYEFTKSKLMPIEIPLLSTAMVAGSLPAGSNIIGQVELEQGGYVAFIYPPYSGNNGDSQYMAANAGQYVVAELFAYNGSGSAGYDRIRSLFGATGILATPTSGMQSLAITSATTTSVKSSAGVIGTLSNASNAATGTITIYDSTTGSGKTLWSGTLSAGQVLTLGLPCSTGITIVTAAADAIAVSYA